MSDDFERWYIAERESGRLEPYGPVGQMKLAAEWAEARMREPLPPTICKHDPPHPRACWVEEHHFSTINAPDVNTCGLCGKDIHLHIPKREGFCLACRDIETARKEDLELTCNIIYPDMLMLFGKENTEWFVNNIRAAFAEKWVMK